MKTLGKKSIASFLKILINILWYFQWCILAFVTVILVIVFVTKDYVDYDVLIKTKKTLTSFTVSAINPNHIDPIVTVKKLNLHFKNKVTPLLVFQAFLFLGLFFFISLTITLLLRKIFQTLTENTPFVAANASRLRQIAFLILLYVPVKIAAALVNNSKATMNFKVNGSNISTDFDIPFEAIIAGLIILVIAEVFRVGTQLKDEQDFTV